MNEQDIFKLLEEQAQKFSNRHQTPIDNHSLTSLKLKCPSGNTAVTYCLSCTNCSVTCVDDECQKCFRLHLKYERMKKIKQFHAQIEETIRPSFILGEIEHNIGSINEMLSNLKKDIQQELRTFKLTQADKEIVKKIKDYHLGQGNLESKDFIKHQQDKEKQKQNWFELETKRLSSIIERSKQMVLQKFQIIQKAIYYEHLENCEAFDQKIFKESNILENRPWKNQMLLLLKDLRPIKLIERIYCASTDGFLSSSFHKQCDNRPNLLYIVRNQFNKTYGGFSPCPISQSRGDKYESDESKSSFVFSLDLHTKSNLVNKQFSIRNSYKPKHKCSVLVAFGNPNSPNLIISENSFGVSRDNWIDMYGGAYEENNDNLEELIGTKEHMMCKLKQFQVFQIFFNGDQGNNQIQSHDEIQKCDNVSAKVEVQRAMDIEKNEPGKKEKFNDNELKNIQNQQEEELKEQSLGPKKGGRTKKIIKPAAGKEAKKQPAPAKQPGKKPAKNSIKSELKPVQKRGRPKKKQKQQKDSDSNYYLLGDEDDQEEQENQEVNEESEVGQQNGATLLQHLFGKRQQRLGRLSFLFRQNNNHQQSDSNERRQWHNHRLHGGHGHWRRHHYW